MKRIAFLSMLVGCLILSLLAVPAEGGYVRKKIKPNFFMPEEGDKQEKLPNFPALEKGILQVNDDGVILVKKSVSTYMPSKKEKELPAPIAKKQLNSRVEGSKNTPYTPDEGLGNDFDKSERYLAMKKSYENDLQIIAKTGEIPQNEQLLKDLQKMGSEVPFVVK